MLKNPRILLSTMIFCLFIMVLLVPVGETPAATVDIEGVNFIVDASMRDNLKSFTGKKIYVTLASGQILNGKLKDVGTHLVHLEKIVGKEFFDSLIRIDTIYAFEAQFREFK